MNGDQNNELAALASRSAAILAEGASAADRTAQFPTASMQSLRDAGLLGLLVPRQYGGLGGDLSDLSEVAQILATGCLSTTMAWAMHCQQVDVLVRYASADLAETILPRVAGGSLYLGSVTTGPAGGSLLSTTSPVQTDLKGLIIEREAPIVTGGMHADGYLVTMRSSPDADDRSVSLLYADRSQLTVTRTGDWDTLGMRGTESLGLSLHGTVPRSQVVGSPGEFREIALESMAPVGHIAWTSSWLGAARGSLSDFTSLLRSSDRPRSIDVSSDLTRERLARIRMDLELVGAYLHRVVEEVLNLRRKGESLDTPRSQIHLNTLKVVGSELTYRSVDRMVQLAGLSLGYRKDSALSLERRLRDLRSASLNFSNDRLLAATGALCLMDRAVTVA